jgi:transcriptional regulator of acetoin/glycerol metabolism
MIIDALKKARGRKSKAAQILGMSRSTLWRKIKAYQIE